VDAINLTEMPLLTEMQVSCRVWLLPLCLVLLPAAATNAVAACTPASFVVALDIGHYKAAPGAISATGVTEFSYNSALAHLVQAGLKQAGFTSTFLIGESGDLLPLQNRTRIARRNGAKLFLSLHHDSVQPRYLSTWTVDGKPQHYSDVFHGYSIFVSQANAQPAQSIQFATLLGQALRAQGLTPSLHHAETIPGENRPLLDAQLGIYRFDGLAVLRTATMPAVLLESAIILNRAEEQSVAHGDHEQHVAAAVTSAVQAFCQADVQPPDSSDKRSR
jgi:N-acetylmuramoyl-L-alanine amidase